MRPTQSMQTIEIRVFGSLKTVSVPFVESRSYREYHIRWRPPQPENIDSLVQVRLRAHIESHPNQVISENQEQHIRDSLRTIYETQYRPRRKPLIQDWTKDFKFIVGLSNGIVAGEIFGLYGELKFGEKTGFAVEGGYCPGFNRTYDERWSVGVKGYYNYWCLSANYGTTMSIWNKNASFTMNDDGTFILPDSRTAGRHGITMLCGYDRNWGWFHFNAGIGGTITTAVKPKFLLAWNVGVGVSLLDLLYK